jgi:hypothetical protein
MFQALANAGLRVAGLATLAIGIAHFFLPRLGYDASVPASMNATTAAHFYYLGTYAIGGFLCAFGVLSLGVSKLKNDFAAGAFATVMAAVWAWRTVLEIVYPVNLQLFFLAKPTVVLLPIIAALALIYATSAIGLFSARAR